MAMARLFPVGKSAEDQTNRERIRSIPVWGRWLALVIIMVALGIVLRIFAAQSPMDVSAWLPWLNQPTVTLYFTDPEGMYFVPISRPLSASEDLPQQALQKLIDGPKAGTGLVSALPADTKIRSLAVRDGIAFVDLSASFLTNPVRTVGQAVTAVEKTLAALPEVQAVSLSIEGQPLAAVIDLPPVPAEETTATLYFVHGAYLVPVDYSLPTRANTPRQALELYLQGPPAEGSLAGLPPGTELLDFDFNPTNGLARINLTYSEEIRAMAIADPAKTRQVLTSIIFTLTEYPDVKAVMLDFEGHDQLGLGQCSSLLRTAQLRPTILNHEQTARF
jgi:spore germination protein GerM